MILTGDLAARAAKVRLAVFDVDGVLTDGSLVYTADGEQTKTFNTLDGHGLKMLQASGVHLAIISGRRSAALARRANDLGIAHCLMGIDDKRTAFLELTASLQLTAEQAAGLGDDVVDLPFLIRCGLSACVPNAPAFVKSHVHFVTRANGGHGAAREFCEAIMAAQGTLESALQHYLD